jgi:hypothetical protein
VLQLVAVLQLLLLSCMTASRGVLRPWHEACVAWLQGGMMTSPSGNLGGQFNMGRVPSMGLGNLDSMELPDTVRASCTP